MPFRHKLDVDDFHQQFPACDRHMAAAENYSRPDWHTMIQGVPEDHARETVKFRRGGAVPDVHGVHVGKNVRFTGVK